MHYFFRCIYTNTICCFMLYWNHISYHRLNLYDPLKNGNYQTTIEILEFGGNSRNTILSSSALTMWDNIGNLEYKRHALPGPCFSPTAPRKGSVTIRGGWRSPTNGDRPKIGYICYKGLIKVTFCKLIK